MVQPTCMEHLNQEHLMNKTPAMIVDSRDEQTAKECA